MRDRKRTEGARERSEQARIDGERACQRSDRPWIDGEHARSQDHGVEFAQHVFAEAVDPERSHWDPERDPDLARFLVGRVNGALATDRKKLRVRADPRAVASIEARYYGAELGRRAGSRSSPRCSRRSRCRSC